MSVSNSRNKYYVQSSLPGAVRKKPKYDYGPKELTTSLGEQDKSTTLNKRFGTHKRN